VKRKLIAIAGTYGVPLLFAKTFDVQDIMGRIDVLLGFSPPEADPED
jgi:hypothetical protein